jgi:anti-sigma B factor antagonist
MPWKDFTFATDRTGDTVVVRLAGQLDMAATFTLEPALERLTRDRAARALVVDMAGVEFMDSSALGLLLTTQQRLQSEDVQFVVANPSTSVRRLLELTGAGDVLSIATKPAGG